MKQLLLVALLNLAGIAFATTVFPRAVVIDGSGLTVLSASDTQVQVQGTVTAIKLDY